MEVVMSKWKLMGLFCVGSLLALLTGCAGREVEITGEVRAAAGIDVKGPILLELYDAKGAGQERELERVHAVKIDALGSFTEKAGFKHESVVVRALDDRDGDGACTEGEAWGEVEAPIRADDTTAPVQVVLIANPCAE
jgi:hypothetical protein